MSRYFFNLADGTYEADETGTELASIGAARKYAVHYAAEVMRDQPDVIWAGHDFRVEVTDEAGLQLFTIIIIGVDSPATLARHDQDAA